MLQPKLSVANVVGVESAHGDLLSVADLDPAQTAQIVDRAWRLKHEATLPGQVPPLHGRAVALIFEKPSLRTRVSFEVGLARLGATSVILRGDEIGIGTREETADLGAVLSRYVDAIVARLYSHRALVTLADAADVPVVNALTDREHPCQALADILTLRENLGRLQGRRLAFVGDGNNVCHSLMLAGAAMGMDVRVATPVGYEPDAAVVERARAIGAGTGGQVHLTHAPREAVESAHAVYTDVWTSMGAEAEAEQRRVAFAGYQVSRDLLRGAPHAIVMHCLPAHRGQEIEAEVLDGPRSVVLDQAENRLFAQQAVMLRLLGGRTPVATFAARSVDTPTLHAAFARDA